MCGCGCGLPRRVAHDPKQPFLVDKFTCYASRAIDRVRRKAADEAQRLKKDDGWDAGTHYYALPHETEPKGASDD